MSAFFVPAATIDDTVRLLEVEGSHLFMDLSRDRLGHLLWEMNADAVIYRYDLDNSEEAGAMRRAAGNYVFRPTHAGRYPQVKSAICLLYQCYEGNIPLSGLFRHVTDTVDPLWNRMEYHKRMRSAEWGRDGAPDDPRNIHLKAEPMDCS